MLECLEAETAGETGILEVDEEAVPAVQPVATDQLGQQRGLAAAAHALDDERGAL